MECTVKLLKSATISPQTSLISSRSSSTFPQPSPTFPKHHQPLQTFSVSPNIPNLSPNINTPHTIPPFNLHPNQSDLNQTKMLQKCRKMKSRRYHLLIGKKMNQKKWRNETSLIKSFLRHILVQRQ
jgi:hypothetical protein